jgi:hypothetical protein
MANEKNLIPFDERTESEQREIARQGGIASGIARREKKTVQKILNDFLSTAAKDNPQVAKLAAKMGLQDDGSIKDLFTIVCTLNTLKDGNLSDLERLSKLLGEQTEVADTEAEKQAAFLDAVKKAVTDAD